MKCFTWWRLACGLGGLISMTTPRHDKSIHCMEIRCLTAVGRDGPICPMQLAGHTKFPDALLSPFNRHTDTRRQIVRATHCLARLSISLLSFSFDCISTLFCFILGAHLLLNGFFTNALSRCSHCRCFDRGLNFCCLTAFFLQGRFTLSIDLCCCLVPTLPLSGIMGGAVTLVFLRDSAFSPIEDTVLCCAIEALAFWKFICMSNRRTHCHEYQRCQADDLLD